MQGLVGFWLIPTVFVKGPGCEESGQHGSGAGCTGLVVLPAGFVMALAWKMTTVEVSDCWLAYPQQHLFQKPWRAQGMLPQRP